MSKFKSDTFGDFKTFWPNTLSFHYGKNSDWKIDSFWDFGTVCSSTTIIFGLLPFDDVSIDTTITELIVDFTKLL